MIQACIKQSKPAKVPLNLPRVRISQRREGEGCEAGAAGPGRDGRREGEGRRFHLSYLGEERRGGVSAAHSGVWPAARRV